MKLLSDFYVLTYISLQTDIKTAKNIQDSPPEEESSYEKEADPTYHHFLLVSQCDFILVLSIFQGKFLFKIDSVMIISIIYPWLMLFLRPTASPCGKDFLVENEL